MARSSTTWKKGQSGNPKGRAPRRREAEYLDVVAKLCPPKTWARIVERAIADAVDGDRHARQWLTERLLSVNAQASLPETQGGSVIAGAFAALLEHERQ